MVKLMNYKRILLPFVALLLLGMALSRIRVSIRSGNKEDERTATMDAIAEFHSRLSAGRFEEIYDNADEIFQKSQTRDRLIGAMRQSRDHYGRFKQVIFSKLNVIIDAPVQIRAVYNSTFDKGDATELFTFVDRHGVVKLVEYQVSPGAVRPAAP